MKKSFKNLPEIKGYKHNPSPVLKGLLKEQDYNPTMLAEPNKFGNKFRFTDPSGGSNFHLYGIVDHITGLFYPAPEPIKK